MINLYTDSIIRLCKSTQSLAFWYHLSFLNLLGRNSMSIASVSTKFSSFTLDNYKLIHFIFIILSSTKSEISSEWNPFKIFINFYKSYYLIPSVLLSKWFIQQHNSWRNISLFHFVIKSLDWKWINIFF